MFGKLFSYATSGITSLIAKYAVRASVALPFLLAFAFGLAGLTVILIDHYGYRMAYFLLAAAFASLGVVAGIAVWLKERREEVAPPGDNYTTSPTRIAETALETAKRLPSAVAAGATDASSSTRGLADLAVRHWALLAAMGIVAIVLGGMSPEHKNDRRHTRF